MTQDNAAKASEFVEVGRSVFGDRWAEQVEALAADVNYDVANDGALVCNRCGSCVLEDYEQIHRDWHRLLTVGIHFADSAAAAAVAKVHGVEPLPEENK